MLGIIIDFNISTRLTPQNAPINCHQMKTYY